MSLLYGRGRAAEILKNGEENWLTGGMEAAYAAKHLNI